MLYRSERTQVFRRTAPDGRSVIHKRATGPGATHRTGHEQAVLRGLAGIRGVPRLADDRSRRVLILADDDARALDGAPLAVPQLWDLAVDLAWTLAAVHRAGVIHRDITPANVLLTGDGTPLLIDFDLALRGPDRGAPSDGPIGTLGFLAPEQTGRIGTAVDSRADLYGLGATLYALATGVPPIAGTDTLALVRDTLVRPPVPPERCRAGLPSRFAAIVMRLLEKDPARRYQSAEGLAHDLARGRDDPDGRGPLGDRDFPAFLVPPAHPVGRDTEIGPLTEALDRSLRGGGPALLVTGPPGIGKSTLLRTLRPLVTARGGWFAPGRFDRFRTGTGTGGITRALRALVQAALAEPEPEIAEDRRRLAAELGGDTEVVHAAIPEMAGLLGLPDRPVAADPLSDQDRDRAGAAAVAVLRGFAARHRIVLVLDDLQWAGDGSLRVLEAILNAGPIPGLLITGTYRDAEPELRALIERGQRAGRIAPEIRLGGLGPDGAAALVGAVLRLRPPAAAGLAEAVRDGAGGSPYTMVELLNGLRSERLLSLSAEGWRWEPEAVRSFVAAHQVPRLLSVRVEQLPAPARHHLAALSGLGGDVATGLLAAATGTAEPALTRDLTPAADGGLILITGGTVRFRLDLVHQTARELWTAAEREQTHLDMARRLAGRPGYEQEAAEQYLAAADLVTDPAERRAAAVLLHAAGRRTARLTNHGVAAELFDAAARLVADPDPLSDVIAADRHATLYCLGRLDEADRIHQDLAARPADLLVLAGAAAVQVNLLAQRGDSRSSWELGLDMLRRFGVEPPDDLASYVRAETAGLRDRLDDLDLAGETTDPRVLAAGRLLNRLLVPAYRLGPLHHAWVVLQAYRLWQREGVCPPVIGAAGAVICTTIDQLDDYRTGYRLSRYVAETGRAHGYRAETAVARYMYLYLAAHWFEPLEEIADAGPQARDDLLAAGDGLVAGLSSVRQAAALFDTADSLETVAEEITAALAAAEHTGNRTAALSLIGYRDLVRGLREPEPEPEPPEPEGLHTYPPALAGHHVNRALAALLRDDPAALDEHSAAAMRHHGAIRGFYVSALARLVRCLSLTARLRDGDHTVTGELGELRDWLAARAGDAPRNFRPLLHLVDAERSWARGDPDTAARHFDAGLDEVTGRPWHRALLAERAARFHLERGMAHTGHRLLIEARDTYRDWGAGGPLSRLETGHPFLRATAGESGSGAGADRIDLVAILRATRALSSATSLSGLEDQVGDVLSAMTGATHVRLVLPNHTGAGTDRLASAVRYVLRTGKPLLVADATRDARFAGEPYLAGLGTCALLAVPIPSRDAGGAVLLLENHRQDGVFATDRLEAVRLIAGQLAVSLDNALLYDSLEDTVRVRTADLADRHRELEAANQLKADLIGMLGHEINNPLAMMLGNLDLALAEDDLPGGTRQIVGKVHRTTQRLAVIVQEVLDLVSLDAGRLMAAPVPVRVAEHVDAALVATATGRVPVVCPPDLEAMVQPGHLDQILTNLISNAAKYGGGVTAIVARRRGPDVTVEVRDEGPGVPPEFRDRLFDRFARAESTAGTVTGTGLGLYIVRELARANGGDVDHHPGENGGSTFVLRMRSVPPDPPG
ncbi:GAF domain-containing sensor histidine kinase [Actinoplanes couchii]|uniref:GAF domain-containing sensor histidine kinase n=1 Tax=Actinoplanes couchii TaxID=403638 RepID=UPI00286C4061|nr:AAA family ATPase [Actinoplanes couchii]